MTNKRLTVEEQYNAERGIKKVPPIKRGLFARFRSAISGRWVSALFAKLNPSTTVREKVRK